MTSSYEALQAIAQSRYKQDVPGALKKALENGNPGITGGLSGGTTGLNGLATIAYNTLNDPDVVGKYREWQDGADGAATNPYGAAHFTLNFATAP